MTAMAELRALPLLALLPLLPGCGVWFFSGVQEVDRTRPVAVVETTGGVEFAATTQYGILTLGRTATEGPCRVHYFLGPTPMVEDGALAATGSTFCRAQIDLRTQNLRVLDRSPQTDDELMAMWTPTGDDVVRVPVTLAQLAGVEGDALTDPGRELPPGAAVFARTREGLRFCGLVSGRAVLTDASGRRAVYTFAGVDRVRELLAIPELQSPPQQVRYRPDDITVVQPRR